VEKIQVLLKALEVMQNLFFSWKLNNILSWDGRIEDLILRKNRSIEGFVLLPFLFGFLSSPSVQCLGVMVWHELLEGSTMTYTVLWNSTCQFINAMCSCLWVHLLLNKYKMRILYARTWESFTSRTQYCFSFLFLWVVTQVDCLAATALELLLKLKRHLKIVYGLNDARCQVKTVYIWFLSVLCFTIPCMCQNCPQLIYMA
jgi:hypothetical protein